MRERFVLIQVLLHLFIVRSKDFAGINLQVAPVGGHRLGQELGPLGAPVRWGQREKAWLRSSSSSATRRVDVSVHHINRYASQVSIDIFYGQRTHLGLGTKRASQHPESVELLQPLAVFDISLAPRNILDMVSVD